MLLPKIWIICRVCLKQQEEMYNIFDDTLSTNIWSLLRDCGGVPVRKNDDLPDQICNSCLKRLWKAISFRIDCQRGHRDLVQKLINRYDIIREEEKCSDISMISNPKSSHNSSTKVEPQLSTNKNENDEKNENIADILNENKVFENENNNRNIKEYCVVTKKYKTDLEKNDKSERKMPIVLLLKLKNTPDEQNHSAINETGVATKTTPKLKADKQTTTKGSNKSGINTNSKGKYNTTKTKLKSKLTRKNGKFECKVCKKTYKTNKLLCHHKRYVHKRRNQSKNNHKNQEFKCEKCNKIFKFLYFLRKHVRYHRPKK